MEILQNMALLSELVRCGGDVYTWCYKPDGALIRSNCPDEAILNAAFEQFGCKARMLKRAAEQTAPMTLGTAIGINWFADFERRDGELVRCWVLGPVFYRDLSMHAIEQGFAYYNKLELSIAWKMRLFDALHRLPAASNIIMQRYALMLHYCLTEEHLDASALAIWEGQTAPAEESAPRDRHKVYMAERALLDMVRNGDLNYRGALNNSMMLSSGVPLESADALRQSKTAVAVFATLVSRAAMEGGLSPEEAYSVSDSYIQTAENGKTLDEIMPLGGMLYDDFIRRVHRLRQNPQYSPPVQRCCEYIEQHLAEKIVAADLAKATGYSEYYLTHRFKQETGISVNDYVKFVKIERAKTLLLSTSASTAELAAELSFGTRSYFSSVFTKLVGQTPQQYRASGGKA